MDKYYIGRKVSVAFIEECMCVLDQDMIEVVKKISDEEIPKVPVVWFNYFKERQIESNDWRRKGKRGFNGYP